MKRLIVNADDFGLTAKVNEAIVDGHRRGVISSTSLLANGEAFEAAVVLSRQVPSLGIGVHWNLVEGRPVAAASSIPSLTKGTEFFARGPGGLSQAIILGRVSRSEIETELRAQIDKIRDAGISPTHLDSHKHVHALPAIGKIAVKVASEYGIGAMRRVSESSSQIDSLMRRHPWSAATIIRQNLSGRALGLLSAGWGRQLRQAGIAFPAHFYGFTATGFLDRYVLGRILSAVPEGTSELMCHPGVVDGALRRTRTRLLDQREVEYHALTDPATRSQVEDLGIRLINYREIIDAPSREVSEEDLVNPKRLSA